MNNNNENEKLTGCLAGYIFVEWWLLLFVIGKDCGDGGGGRFNNDEKELLFVEGWGKGEGGRGGRNGWGGGKGGIFGCFCLSNLMVNKWKCEKWTGFFFSLNSENSTHNNK